MTLAFRNVIDGMLATPNRSGRDNPPSIKLSQNEMPWEPAPVIVEAMERSLRSVNRYPDFHRTEARSAIAASLGVEADRIAIDNGSGALLHGLARLMCEPGVHGIYGWPSFEAYPAALGLAGAASTAVPLTAAGAMDLHGMIEAITAATRIVYICNPNNPTGILVKTAELRTFLQEVPSHILVVLDEAYREFVTAEPVDSTLALLDNFANLVILRTLSKSHGLAGVRAGYAVTASRTAEAVRRTSVGFALNSFAEAAVIAAFSPEGQSVAAERIALIVEERGRMEKSLLSAGVSFLPSQSNFIFIHGDAAKLMAQLEKHDVLGRPFPQAGGIRITVGLATENDATLSALL